jgi:hypothetical protein
MTQAREAQPPRQPSCGGRAISRIDIEAPAATGVRCSRHKHSGLPDLQITLDTNDSARIFEPPPPPARRVRQNQPVLASRSWLRTCRTWTALRCGSVSR